MALEKEATRYASDRRQQSTLERFQATIRRVVSKDDDRSSLVDDIACVVGAEILEGLRRRAVTSTRLSSRGVSAPAARRRARRWVILEKEGLVEILPRRRPRVADLSIWKSARSIACVPRCSPDCGGGHSACERCRDRRVARILREMERTRMRTIATVLLEQCRVHERFADLAKNKTLKRILESLALRSLRLRRVTLSSPGRMGRSLADHTRLVGALEDRDGELASALIKANVLGALRLLEQVLADGDGKAKS